MRFETAKSLTFGLLIAGLAAGAVGAFMLEKGSAAYAGAEIVTMLLLLGGVAVGAIWARCPKCGKHLFFNMLKWKTCPKCRCDLGGGQTKVKR